MEKTGSICSGKHKGGEISRASCLPDGEGEGGVLDEWELCSSCLGMEEVGMASGVGMQREVAGVRC